MNDADNNFQLKFDPPWEDINEYPQDIGNTLSKELKRELHRKHPLYGIKVALIGKRQDNDDILVELEDGRVAVVHLTWKGRGESGPWPSTRIYQSKKDFWEKAMRLDIKDFE
ncbi:MAG: hypothetical protein Roseis2KO_58230 [Roseivirga sp.]